MSESQHDLYEELLAGAAHLRRSALISAERCGNTRRLVFDGAAHVAIRRWIDAERLATGMLQSESTRRPCGAFAVDVWPTSPQGSANELLAELAGD